MPKIKQNTLQPHDSSPLTGFGMQNRGQLLLQKKNKTILSCCFRRPGFGHRDRVRNGSPTRYQFQTTALPTIHKKTNDSKKLTWCHARFAPVAIFEQAAHRSCQKNASRLDRLGAAHRQRLA